MLFLINKYSTWYYNIINRAQSRTLEGYVERHHIIPKCLGGTNERSNLVALTAKEHYICHRLLIRMTSDDAKKKMIKALSAFRASGRNKGRRLTSNQYEQIRLETVDDVPWNKGLKWSDEARAKISAGRSGQIRKLSPESQASLVKKLKERIITDEHRANLSKSLKGRPAPNKGKKHSPETIEKLKAAKRKRDDLKRLAALNH
jgi:hypothetical protein